MTTGYAGNEKTKLFSLPMLGQLMRLVFFVLTLTFVYGWNERSWLDVLIGFGVGCLLCWNLYRGIANHREEHPDATPRGIALGVIKQFGWFIAAIIVFFTLVGLYNWLYFR